MGSGKSTLGSKLARKIQYNFVDMDALIEETAGMTIPGIFKELGEEVFRKWEHDILLELCSKEKVVISTGGGAPCHDRMMQIMNNHGATIYIKLSPEALMNRLQNSKTERPLIKGKTDAELLDYIRFKLTEREHYYAQADYTLDGMGLEAETVIAVIQD